VGIDASEIKPGIWGPKILNHRQTLYIGYTLCVLVDLVVLNLFAEHWDAVVIDSFTISLLAAVLLQVLLKATLAIEHRIAAYFNAKPGTGAKVLRWLSAWAVLFGSKFVILEAVNLAFGEHVEFGGIVPFIVVVFAIIITEVILTRIYYALAHATDATH
jgi:hypothetical protein